MPAGHRGGANKLPPGFVVSGGGAGGDDLIVEEEEGGTTEVMMGEKEGILPPGKERKVLGLGGEGGLLGDDDDESTDGVEGLSPPDRLAVTLGDEFPPSSLNAADFALLATLDIDIPMVRRDIVIFEPKPPPPLSLYRAQNHDESWQQILSFAVGTACIRDTAASMLAALGV